MFASLFSMFSSFLSSNNEPDVDRSTTTMLTPDVSEVIPIESARPMSTAPEENMFGIDSGVEDGTISLNADNILSKFICQENVYYYPHPTRMVFEFEISREKQTFRRKFNR